MDEFRRMVEITSHLYKEGYISITWYSKGNTLKVRRNMDDKLKEHGIDLSEEDFIKKYVFEVIQLSLRVATKDEPKAQTEKEKYDIVDKVFLNEDLKQLIYIHSTSNQDVLDGIDYEILTKRKNNDYSKIITHSALLNLVLRDPYKNDDELSTKKVLVEMSQNEIDLFVKKLEEISKSLNHLNSK